jgi:HlyD family secretion protein
MNTLQPIRYPALCLSLAFGIACQGADVEQSPPNLSPLVEAVQSRIGALPIEVTLPGVVRARNQVAIRPEVEGRVVEVFVRSGDSVERGQPLVRLDAVEASERLRQAEADVRLAQATATAVRARVVELEARVARTRTLADEELVSEQELETLEAQLDALRASTDEAAARVEQAQATVEERRSAQAKTVVRAPVSGRLGERRAEIGMLIDSADILFVMGDLDELIVEVNLTEAMLSSVQEGQTVEIEARSGDVEPIRATLSRISPFLAEDSFSTLGEIEVDNRGGQLRPGMFANVRILVGQSQQTTLVPVGAVWEDPTSGRRGVFAIQEAAGLDEPSSPELESSDTTYPVAFRPVEVLAEGRGAAGVTGIETGTWVVIVGQHLLHEQLQLAAEATEAGNDGDSGASDSTTARVRPVSWQHVMELQDLQDEDLLEGFLEKQRILAAAIGAEIPESEDVVDQALDEAAAKRQQPVEP